MDPQRTDLSVQQMLGVLRGRSAWLAVCLVPAMAATYGVSAQERWKNICVSGRSLRTTHATSRNERAPGHHRIAFMSSTAVTARERNRDSAQGLKVPVCGRCRHAMSQCAGGQVGSWS